MAILQGQALNFIYILKKNEEFNDELMNRFNFRMC